MRTIILALGAVMLSSVAVLAGEMPAGISTSETAMGNVLANDKSMTLYTFAKDASGKSNCNGECAKLWPPVAASANAKPVGDFSKVTRDDGSMQWAYKGMPVYGWVKDKKPGDTSGEGVKGVWHVAKP